MSNLDKAREWAESVGNIEGLMPGTRATVEVIQSLPDQWVDVEKVLEVLDGWDIAGKALRETDLGKRLAALLLPPKLPTLADMTPEERLACQFMQARLEDGTLGIIVCPGDPRSCVILEDGGFFTLSNKSVTPLQGEPKLKWPGSEPSIKEDPLPSGMWVDDGSSPLDVMKLLAEKWEEVDRLKPEEVPPNEPWLIEVNGWKAVGTRYAGHSTITWAVAALDGSFAVCHSDSEVTLIHKLVPEPPALPEGMRLADNEEFGRVVTSPWADDDNDYRIFFLNEDARGGANYDFAHESTLTFLDGGE